MVGGKNAIPVDPERFKQILKDKGLNMYTMSEEMGYSRKYIHGKLTGNGKATPGFSKGDATYFKNIYGIKPEDYAPVVEGAVIKVAPTAITIIEALEVFLLKNKDEIQQMITEAVVDALAEVGTDAWNLVRDDHE
jgi:hypothetical protein